MGFTDTSAVIGDYGNTTSSNTFKEQGAIFNKCPATIYIHVGLTEYVIILVVLSEVFR